MIAYCSREIVADQLAYPPARCPVLVGFRLLAECSDSRQQVRPVEAWAVYAVHRETEEEGE